MDHRSATARRPAAMRRAGLAFLSVLLLAAGLACDAVGTSLAPPTTAPPTETVAPTTTTPPTATMAPPVTDHPGPAPYTVEGTVTLENGRCCAGGVAGDTIQVTAQFSATSPTAAVTEMRVRAGGMAFDEATLAGAPWEPFAPERAFPVHVALNWVGFYVSVQYRDAKGNLSPVISDDISVEGAPPTTPTG